MLQCFPSLQRLLVKEALTALTSLWLHNACEVFDDKAPLQSLPGLQVTFDTLNKAYHGEWWAHLRHLYTKCPCNVALGVAGHFPEGLETLCLHTCCPEPLTVTTGVMTSQPKPYPHRVGLDTSLYCSGVQLNAKESDHIGCHSQVRVNQAPCRRNLCNREPPQFCHADMQLFGLR